MEDRNFRRELHCLKQQVSELSPKYNPSPRHMALHPPRGQPIDDPFAVQLHDVNTQMTTMEDTMRELKRRLQQPLEAAKGSDNLCSADDITSQGQLSLPSGPIFWQLFNSLRSDLRTIDGRVATLERSVSDLEDRVDGMDPNRFTPTSSTASSEVGCTQPVQEWPVNRNLNPDFQSSMLPELHNGANTSQGCLPIPAEQPYWQQPYWQPVTERPLVYPNVLHPHLDLPPYQPSYNQVRPPYEASLRSETTAATSTINHLHQQNDAIQDRINKIDRENEVMLQAIRSLTQHPDRPPRHTENVQAELPSMSWPKPFETPEVRFRDREIARMDELLRTLQERLRSTEESMAQRDASIAQLRAERDEQRARESAERANQMRDQLIHYCDVIDAKDAEIGDLQGQLAQRNDALQRWSESWNDLSASHARADEQVTSFKHAYYDSMIRADNDIQRISSDHAEETAKLKEFCEQKDVVIQRQEDVIARGGNLLEQRDEEIEDISRQLRAAEDDRKHSRRTQERLSRLLSERGAEIEQLKQEMRPANAEPVEHRAAGPGNERNGITWDDPLPVPDNQSWPSFPLPERVRDNDRERDQMQLPTCHENRAWVQVGGSPLQFQKMSSLGERRKHPAEEERRDEPGPVVEAFDQPSYRNGPKRRSKRQRRYTHRHYPELDTQPATSLQTRNWVSRQVETRESEGPAPSEQGSRALDDAVNYWPPLPAPVTARRMASDANLHSRAYEHMGARRNLSKHHSMQELSTRRLQAYVETEPESGGEIGKEV